MGDDGSGTFDGSIRNPYHTAHYWSLVVAHVVDERAFGSAADDFDSDVHRHCCGVVASFGDGAAVVAAAAVAAARAAARVHCYSCVAGAAAAVVAVLVVVVAAAVVVAELVVAPVVVPVASVQMAAAPVWCAVGGLLDALAGALTATGD